MIARPASRFTASAALTMIAAIAACSYDYAELTAHVRDRATGEPVADVQVKVSNTRTVNPVPPKSDDAETDSYGRARLDAALYNDLLLRVSTPNRSVYFFTAEHPALIGDTGWLSPTFTRDEKRPGLQLRLTPGPPSYCGGVRW